MKSKAAQRGSLLIAAIILITSIALLAGVISFLVASNASSSTGHLSSAQALTIAESGLQGAALQFKSGTACAAINAANPVGTGSYTTTGTSFTPAATTLSAAITAAAGTIPVSSTVGYAPHGRIRIENEEINYGAIVGNTFTGARRGAAGSTAAAHAAAIVVTQNQCLLRSTGTNAAGGATRILEAGVLPAPIRFLDSGVTAVGVAATTIGTLNTTLPAGNNLIVVVVSLSNTAAARDIAVGDLRLVRGATLASNQYLIRVGGGLPPPSATVFPRETQFLVFQDLAAPANAVYNVTAQASGLNISAEVKMLVINGVPNSSFQDGGSVALTAAGATILNHNSTVPAGNNVIIAAVSVDNPDGATRTITAGNLRLNRGAAVLAANEFAIDLARTARVNKGTGVLLIAADNGAPASPSYTVTGLDTGGGTPRITAEAKVMVLSGLPFTFTDGAAVAVGVAATPLAALASTFPAGENVVIAASQYDNTDNAAAGRNILAGNERIVFNAITQASNQFQISLCLTSTVECDDFPSGLLWHQPATAPNPSYDVQALANNAGINGEAKGVAIHLDTPLIDWQEIFP